MTTAIRMEFQNATKSGFDEIVKDLDRLSGKSRGAKDAISGLNQALNDKDAQAFASQLMALREGLERVGSGAADVAEKSGSLIHSFGTLADAASKAYQDLNTLGESEEALSESANKLVNSQDGLLGALDGDQINQFQAGIDGLDASLGDLGAEFGHAGDGSSSFWSKTQAGFDKAQEAFGWVQMGFSAISTYVQKMADDGNSSFQKLVNASAKFQDALFKIGDNEAISKNVEELADAIDGLGSDFDSLGTVVGNTWSLLAKGAKSVVGDYVKLGEVIGVLPEGISEAYEEEGKAREELQNKRAVERAKERAEREAEKLQKKKDAEEALLNPGIKMRAEGDRGERLDHLKGLEGEKTLTAEINSLLEEQATQITKIRAAGKDPTTDEKAIANAEQLMELEQRRMALIQENKEKEKKLQDMKAVAELEGFQTDIAHIDEILARGDLSQEKSAELEKRRSDLMKQLDEQERKLMSERGELEEYEFQKQLAEIETRKQKEWDAIEASIEGEKRLAEARAAKRKADEEAEQKKVDQLKEFLRAQHQAIGARHDQGQQGPDVIGQMQGGIKPAQMRKKVFQNREDKAVLEWKNQKFRDGLMDEDGNALDPHGDFDKAPEKERQQRANARLKSQENAVRRKAKMGAMKDARLGKIGNEEVADASGELLQQAGENVIGSNKLNQTQVSAIRQTVQELRNQQQAQAQLRDQLDQITQQLQNMSSAPKSRNQARR